MSSDKANGGHNSLKIDKFDHSTTTPRAQRWREWMFRLRSAFGSAHPLLANQMSDVLDHTQYWWGLTWSALLDIDNMSQEQEQKLYVDFQKAQYSLLHVMSDNFGSHEKQIIADHDPVTLVGKLTQKYSQFWDATLGSFPDRPGWTPTTWMTTWLPFGYMCMHSIAAKYVDTGVTNAITMFDEYVRSRTFTPSNINKWVSGVSHSWAEWRNSITDPEHMAAVELIREILNSDNEDWKSWAFSFATQQGDKPYTVAYLLDKVVNQDKLFKAGGTKKKATALLGVGHQSRPAFKKSHKSKQPKQTKRCSTPDCNNNVKVPYHRYCDSCFSARKQKFSADGDSSALNDVPASVREQNKRKKLNNLKKNIARLSNTTNKSEIAAIAQEANALLASMDAPAKKKNKKKVENTQEEEEEAGLAVLMRPSRLRGTQSKPEPAPEETAQLCQLDSMLAGCAVQRFAGCSPSSKSL